METIKIRNSLFLIFIVDATEIKQTLIAQTLIAQTLVATPLLSRFNQKGSAHP